MVFIRIPRAFRNGAESLAISSVGDEFCRSLSDHSVFYNSDQREPSFGVVGRSSYHKTAANISHSEAHSLFPRAQSYDVYFKSQP